MTTRITTTGILALAAGAALSAAAVAGPMDRTLYAIANSSLDPGTGILVAFDPDNPADSELVGNLNAAGLVALTYDPRNDFFISSTFDQLFQVDRATGNATPFPEQADVARLAGHTYVPERDLMLVAFSQPTDSGFDRRIGSINADGTVTELFDFTGDLTGVDEFDELIWDPASGLLRAFDGQDQAWYEIDLDLGQIVNSGNFNDGQTLASADRNPENGQIYMVDRVPPDFTNPFDIPPDIFIRDSATFAIAGNPGLIGEPSIDDVNGLAFIPSPGAVALLGLGGLAGVRRRR
jgi:hypothetical protein